MQQSDAETYTVRVTSSTGTLDSVPATLTIGTTGGGNGGGNNGGGSGITSYRSQNENPAGR